MPSDTALKLMNGVHRVILKASGGRLGWTGANMPVIELTTTGRKSGQPRSVMLTCPVVDGDTYVIVASRGGDDTHPAWYHNLVANPEVTVKDKAGTRAMKARVATPEERAVLWPRITGPHKNYAGYQEKTGRVIPVVLLEPA